MPLRQLLWNYILHAAIQTVLEVSADHITSLSCSSSLSPSNKKAFMLHTVSVRISITQSILHVWTLNTMFQDRQKAFRQSSSDGIVQFLHAHGQNEILNWMKGWMCEMLCDVWWACLRSASLDSMPFMLGWHLQTSSLAETALLLSLNHSKRTIQCVQRICSTLSMHVFSVLWRFKKKNVIKHFVIFCVCNCQ